LTARNFPQTLLEKLAMLLRTLCCIRERERGQVKKVEKGSGQGRKD